MNTLPHCKTLDPRTKFRRFYNRKSSFRFGNQYFKIENLGKWAGQNPDFLFFVSGTQPRTTSQFGDEICDRRPQISPTFAAAGRFYPRINPWVQAMGLTHGFDPWVRPVGLTHGFDLFNLEAKFVAEGHKFRRLLRPQAALIPGSNPWFRPMVPTHGFDPWVRPMGPNPWVRPMGSTHGIEI